ncbi:MAG: hypothetical protein LBG15_10750 [Dysgonamonadaceae bacterium]|jgi:hypothetical protein|nr:hypothetical protein [Dysgonamonadaceae bacterium]
MLYRIIKVSDIKEVVNVHYDTRCLNAKGIFAMLGKPFLSQYYKIVIEDRYSIVLGAEGDDGKIQGLCFAIIDSKKHDANLKKHKFQLAWSAISSIVQKPVVLKNMIDRYKSLKTEDDKFVVSHGTRIGFWGWSPKYKNPNASIGLLRACLHILKDIGVRDVFIEVDQFNDISYQVHSFLGAIPVKKMILPDGRERIVLKYELLNLDVR